MFGLKEREEQKTITSFDYIDKSVDSALEKPIVLSDTVKEKVRKDAHKTVAGFRIHDPKAEAEALDKMIADRRKSVETFIADRTAVRKKISDLGVTCLAVVPKGAWFTICQKTGLIVLAPDRDGTVTVSRDAIRQYRTAKAAEQFARSSPVEYIKSLFPDKVSHGMNAHVILPTPPAEVAETLLKVQSLGLKVAAVPEAISIRETPTQLFDYQRAMEVEEARIAEMIRLDPIVYHEHGTAAAVICQFGDFPIEKKVVDMVISADALIPDKLTGTESYLFNTGTHLSVALPPNAVISPNGALLGYGSAQAIYTQMIQAQQQNILANQYLSNSTLTF